jgi:signal transduction histidine kinase
MTRRLVIALLALIIAVVVGAMVPLAINSTGHDRDSFLQDTAETARTYAAIEQGPLSGSPNAAVVKTLEQVRMVGDGLMIVPVHSKAQALETGMPQGNWSALVAAVKAQNPHARNASDVQSITELNSSWAAAATAVYENGEPPLVGVVILARSAEPLNTEIRTLWLILGAIGVAAILGATLLAVWLARWVSKPLGGLDAAARKLADGNLTIRAKAGGPPELRRLAGTFNTMAGRLESLVHGSRAVVADVSHQLRTPLAALRLRLDLLAADAAETDPEMATELAGAQDEVARLSRMVDGLLAVARAENVLPQPRALDVAEVAHERVAAWLPVAEDRGIELTATGTKVVGWLGEGHLEQILDNLIANALDALSPGNRISVEARDTADGVRITVTDNGPGMTEEDRERAFLRFTTKSAGGTGLGLAIVHRLTTSNGGHAALEPAPGGGLRVVLDFPGVPGAQEPAGQGAAARQAAALTEAETISS